MDIQKKQGENSSIELTVVLDDSEMAIYREKATKKLIKEVKIDGFRQGHVPVEVAKSRIGASAIEQEAVDIAINESYSKALQSEKIVPIDRPDVKLESLSPVKVVYIVPVYPEVSVQKDGLDAFKAEEINISDDEINETIESFRKNLASDTAVERAAQTGDIVEIDFDGKDENGVPQAGMKSEFHPLEIGSKTFIPGFEEELIGLSAGEEKTFPITFPEEYHAPEYAGKTFYFTVKIHAVKEKTLPEVNDEFVKKLTGKDETVADLKVEIEKHLSEKKKNENYAAKQQALFDAIGMNTTAELPKSMVDEEVETIIDNIKMQGLQMGLPWEKYLEMTKKTEEEMKTEVRSQAEKTVKSRLGLRKLLDEETVPVSEDEIEAEIAREINNAPANKKKEKQALYNKGNEGWYQIENRLQIRAFFKKMIQV